MRSRLLLLLSTRVSMALERVVTVTVPSVISDGQNLCSGMVSRSNRMCFLSIEIVVSRVMPQYLVNQHPSPPSSSTVLCLRYSIFANRVVEQYGKSGQARRRKATRPQTPDRPLANMDKRDYRLIGKPTGRRSQLLRHLQMSLQLRFYPAF
jgi:hypothetical protein